MNIILLVADSVSYDISKKMTFNEKCHFKSNNHWTNSTWTIPSISNLLTGKISIKNREIYSEKPHCLYEKEITKNELLSYLYTRYYIVLSSPWEIINCLYSNISRIYGATILNTDFAYWNKPDGVDDSKYYIRRLKRDTVLDFKDIPQPFFHFYHYTKTHSEFGLSLDHFLDGIKKGPEYLKKFQIDECSKLDKMLDSIIENCPEETLIIFTSDHGEDFNEICNYNCGHGSIFNESVLHVPLMFYYKGKDISMEREITKNFSSHKDLYKALCLMIREKKFIKPLSMDNHLVFTQGPYYSGLSIKKLEDPKAGILDFKNNLIYTQSMENGMEDIIYFGENKDGEGFDSYRKILLEEITEKNEDIYISIFGVQPGYKEKN